MPAPVRIPVRMLALALAAALLGAAAPTVSPAAAAEPSPPGGSWAQDALTPDSGVLFGASVSNDGFASTAAALDAFEERIGRKLDVHRWYSLWDQDLTGGPVAQDVARGRTPVLSISTKRVSGAAVTWAEVASGSQDSRIRALAGQVKALAAPMFLTFQHEPEYAGYGTPAEYRQAWRRFVEVFRAEGVTNVVWTWVVAPTPFSPNPSTATADELYPGDDVVDWVGLDAYNWFGCRGSSGPQQWRSMADSAASARAFAQAHGKELMLAEYGSVEDPADPNRKAAWLSSAMDTFLSWPEVKAVLYFHHDGNCPWWVDSTQQSIGAFAAAGERAGARTRTSAWLDAPTTFGAAPLAVTFSGARSYAAGRAAGQGIASWQLDFGDGSTPVTSTGALPQAWVHTYAAGDHDARLTVTTTSGEVATDTLRISAAPAPTTKVELKNVTTTTADAYAYADLHGYAGTVRFEWGTTTSYGNVGPAIAVPAVSYVKTVSQRMSGLRTGTTYYVRVTSTSPAGTTVTTTSFQTAGPPTSSKQWTSSSTRTSTTFNAQVHPHRLATSAWIEWGTTTALGNRSATVQLAALTYEKTVTSGALTGLTPGATYYYRVVAQNSAGTLRGPILSKTLPK